MNDRVIWLPDRRREVSASPELDEAIAGLLELARFIKARRYRGPLSGDELGRLEAITSHRTEAFRVAVRRTLDMPDL